jgi:hypothetical protein
MPPIFSDRASHEMNFRVAGKGESASLPTGAAGRLIIIRGR